LYAPDEDSDGVPKLLTFLSPQGRIHKKNAVAKRLAKVIANLTCRRNTKRRKIGMTSNRYSEIGRTSVASPKKHPANEIDLNIDDPSFEMFSMAFAKNNVPIRSKKMKRVSLSNAVEEKIRNGSNA